ncbi:hypothetical protein E4U55_005298, partial [Claviceps digitariae]
MDPQTEAPPVAGRFIAIIVSLLSTTVLTMFLMVFAIYTDSYLFVVASALLQYTLGVNYNMNTRIARLENGECIIGMKTIAMIPLISFDALVNLYLTIIFIIPLRQLYSYKNMPRTPANARLRSVAFRTFGGSVCSLISSITNLSVLMSLDGEPGWVCLICCNCDILFSAVIIQWVTSKDNAGTSRVASSTGAYNGRDSQGPSSSRGLNSGAGTSPTSSTLRDFVLAPPSRVSRLGDQSPSTMQANHGGVMVTTTIETETKPEYTVKLAELSANHRRQGKQGDVEEGVGNGDLS